MCFDFFGARINTCLCATKKVETRDAEVTEEERLFYQWSLYDEKEAVSLASAEEKKTTNRRDAPLRLPPRRVFRLFWSRINMCLTLGLRHSVKHMFMRAPKKSKHMFTLVYYLQYCRPQIHILTTKYALQQLKNHKFIKSQSIIISSQAAAALPEGMERRCDRELLCF